MYLSSYSTWFFLRNATRRDGRAIAPLSFLLLVLCKRRLKGYVALIQDMEIALPRRPARRLDLDLMGARRQS